MALAITFPFSSSACTKTQSFRRAALIAATVAFGCRFFSILAATRTWRAGVAKVRVQPDSEFNNPYSPQALASFGRAGTSASRVGFGISVYIPLGGNRAGTMSTYRNLFITFLLSGIWHGAAGHL